MFMAIVIFGMSLVWLSLSMRTKQTGESMFKAEFWAAKDSLSPTEYWLNRIGFWIAVAGLVLMAITICQVLTIYQR